MIIFGTRQFGYTDEVEGFGMVATSFFHVMWVPLIPLGSYFMFDDDRGVQIPMSIKSILIAWVRSFFAWTTIFSVLMAPQSFGCSCVVGIPAGICWLIMPMLTRPASDRRAQELLELIGA